MAPTHLEKLILELLSMQRSVFFGVQWTVSVGPSTVLAIGGFLILGELGGLGRHLWAIEATTCLSNSPSLSASSSVDAQTRSLQIIYKAIQVREIKTIYYLKQKRTSRTFHLGKEAYRLGKRVLPPLPLCPSRRSNCCLKQSTPLKM